jgi:hypothetical protein
MSRDVNIDELDTFEDDRAGSMVGRKRKCQACEHSSACCS